MNGISAEKNGRKTEDQPVFPEIAARRGNIVHSGDWARRLYFRGLAIVYLIAFLSLWIQIQRLIGSDGLLPARRYFEMAQVRYGSVAYRMLPSLCWISCDDWMLHALCALGTLISVLLLVGIAPRANLILLWATYLSLCVAGQDFLSFQWDTLLLEMTICSLLVAPHGWLPDWGNPARRFAYWPLWGLAFKLMFLSGITKLLSGDTSWLDGTALGFHYYTQPLPSWPAWYMHQLPLSMHRLALLVLFVIEIVYPFLIFAGRIGRTIFGIGTILLMIAIEMTGNFGFFNLQTIVLSIPLLDGRLLTWLFLRRPRDSGMSVLAVQESPKWRVVSGTVVVILILSISLLATVSEIASTARHGKLPSFIMFPIQCADAVLLSWGRPMVLDPLRSLRSINGYGLFRVMTTQRHEIIFETSPDGETWTACEFPYKPENVNRVPPIVAPHMPRLDWQMWFAALDPRGSQDWLTAIIRHLHDGHPTVARFLGRPELKSHPPRYVRLAYYEYKFTSIEQRRLSGAWWSRSFVGHLTGELEKSE